MTNRHGLSRDIPAGIKRIVRQNCGYGCVMCGAAIIEYEHIDPPFAEARVHDARAIALLCPRCHAKVTRGFLAKDTVLEALRDPACKKTGYASELFDIGRTPPTLRFAGSTITDTPVPIRVRGVPLLRIEKAEQERAPFRLSGNFNDSYGKLSLQVVDNEWRSSSSNWDVEAVGAAITIWDAPGHISLRLRAQPPTGLIVEQIDAFIGGIRILANPEEFEVVWPNGSRTTYRSCIASNCGVGFAFG
jgi:hypothetical protein